MKSFIAALSILVSISAQAQNAGNITPCLHLNGGGKACVGSEVVGGQKFAFKEGSEIIGINKMARKALVALNGMTIDGSDQVNVAADELIFPSSGCVKNNIACIGDEVILAPSVAWTPEYPANEQFLVGTKIIGVNPETNRVVIKALPGTWFVSEATVRNLNASDIFVTRGCISGVCAGDIVSGGGVRLLNFGGIVRGVNKKSGKVAVMDLNPDGKTSLNGPTETIKAESVILKSLAPGLDSERAASELKAQKTDK